MIQHLTTHLPTPEQLHKETAGKTKSEATANMKDVYGRAYDENRRLRNEVERLERIVQRQEIELKWRKREAVEVEA